MHHGDDSAAETKRPRFFLWSEWLGYTDDLTECDGIGVVVPSQRLRANDNDHLMT